MAISPTHARRATIAIQRFGLGLRGGDATTLEAVAKNPIKSVIQELARPGIALMRPEIVVKHSLPNYEQAVFDATNTVRISADMSMKFAVVRMRNRERRARIDQHIHQDIKIGFVERLVIFWSNHFSMFTGKSFMVQGAVGHFERERIRENVLGNFIGMMKAVYTHPTMISYLDNENSIGPLSTKGNTEAFFGMNENLAREILELHTMSTDSRNYRAGDRVYDQRDVIELAKLLTGWTYYRLDQVQNDKRRGQFLYRPEWHEYGLRFLVGGQINNYLGAKGQDSAVEAFEHLARQPATSRHIARKLIFNFLMDEPKTDVEERRLERMVDHVSAVFRKYIDAPDQLARVAISLVTYVDEDGDDVLHQKYRKFRSSFEYLVAMLRAYGRQFDFVEEDKSEDNAMLDAVCKGLGQEIWGWQTPDGYPSETADWLTPQGMAFRLNVAYRTAKAFGDENRRVIAPEALARTLYGASISKDTLDAIRKTEPDPDDPKIGPLTGVPVAQKDGLTVLFASPEFMWR